MEEKISNENVIAMKMKCGKHKKEIEHIEKFTPEQSEDLKEKKTHSVELQNSALTISANKEQSSDKQESVKTNKNRVLKRKLTEDGVSIERVLSEGEASSGFETVSSIDSNLDFEDFQLSSSDNEHEYNVIVKIENELAYQNNRNLDGRKCYWTGKSNSSIRYNSESERSLGKYTNPRHGFFRSYKESMYWQRHDWTDSCSKVDDDSRYSRRKGSCDREWRRGGEHSIRSRDSRCCDQSKRYQESLCDENLTERSKKKKAYKGTSRDSSERNYRFTGSKNLSHEVVKRELKNSRSSDRSKANMKRNLPCTKRSSPKSPSASIWKRLDNARPPERFKNNIDRFSRLSNADQPRKKERTPFLVELERKLKEAEQQKSVKMADLAESDQKKTPGNINEAAPMPEGVLTLAAKSMPAVVSTLEAMSMPAAGSTTVAVLAPEAASMPAAVSMPEAVLIPQAIQIPETVANLNPNLEHVSNYASLLSNPNMYSFPTLSVDNLPLVPGPTGLPVHITVTGDQIPHDMDGRRIPVGPNGYYLPLDPTGRLYAHIVSPGNQAVPIHMTEDGILRLPNSEPVPYGPSHNLPVNADGSIIFMGPDSRPLGHCPNLPRQPPLHLLQMTQFTAVGYWQPESQGSTVTVPQTCQVEVEQTSEIRRSREQYSSPSTLQPQSVGPYLLNCIQSSCGEANKADVLMNYQKKALVRQKEVLECKEIEENLDVSSAKGRVKRSIPKKLSQKKTLRDEHSAISSDSDIASTSKPSLEVKKDEENCVQSKEEDFIIKKIKQALKSLDERNFKPPALGRFIISKVFVDVSVETHPHASPLLRNRVKLPFLTPNAKNYDAKRELEMVEKTPITFSFIAQERPSDKGEKAGKVSKTCNKHFYSTKFPVLTFDFAVQCDFTSAIINDLNKKISELEMEAIRLRNINANLLDGFRHVQEVNEKKNEELGKALMEIEERNSEIVTLKHMLNENRK